MADLEALVVAAYVFADEYPVPARGGRRPLVSDAELVALSVAQAAIGISSDRQFLGLIERVLPGWFPRLPDQSQYNRRLRQLVELISSGHRSGSPSSTRTPRTLAPGAISHQPSSRLGADRMNGGSQALAPIPPRFQGFDLLLDRDAAQAELEVKPFS